MSDVLTPQAVEALFLTLLYTEDELAGGYREGRKPPEGAIIVDGIRGSFGFHPGRVEEARPKIAELVRELPDTFMVGGGEGWSFLNLCHDRHDRLWTGLHAIMEQLCVMAIAAGLAQWCLPKAVWDALPGGVPYITFAPEGLPAGSQPASVEPEGSDAS